MINFFERGQDPVQPETGRGRLYLKDDKALYLEDDTGQVTKLAGQGGELTQVESQDTDSIAFQGLGTTVNPLSSELNVSAKADNALEIVTIVGEEGAYVADVSSDLANKLDKVQAGAQSVASTVDFDGGILVASGYFGATSPNIVFDASATSYILDNPGASLIIRKLQDNSASSSLTMAKATSVDGVTSLKSNGAITSLSSVDLFSGSSTTSTYQQFKLENTDGGTVGAFLFTGSGLNIENVSSDGSAIKMPNGSWIRPQNENASLFFTNGINPSDIYSSVNLSQGQLKINGGNGVSNLGYLQIIDGQISLQVVEDGTGTPKDSIVLGDGNIELIADGNRVTVKNTSLTLGDNSKTEISLNNTAIQLLTQTNSILLSETTGLRIDIPSKGASRVLTSDINGFATWQTPTGGGTNDLQDAYDNGELITTDATNGAVTIKRGSALDTDKVLSIKKGDGAEVLSVTGEGATQIARGVDITNTIDGIAQSKSIKIPNGSFIGVQTNQQPLYISNGVNQGPSNSSLALKDGETNLSAGDGTITDGLLSLSKTTGVQLSNYDSGSQSAYLELLTNTLKLVDNTARGFDVTATDVGVNNGTTNITLNPTGIYFNGTVSGDYEFVGIPTATPSFAVGYDSNQKLVKFAVPISGGQVDSVGGGTDITITGTATDPIINAPGIATNATAIGALDLQAITDVGSVTTNGATFGGIVNASRGYFQDSNNNNFPLRVIEAPSATSTNIFMQGNGELGLLGVRADSTRRFNFRSETTTDSNFLLRLYDSAGANSKVMFSTDYATNTFESIATFKATDKILQGVTTDTGEGIQGTSLGIDGDVNFRGIVDATPTKALGLNASDKVITYSVPSQSPRVTSVVSTTTLTIDVTTTDQSVITAQSSALTIAIPTGSPADGVKQVIRIKDNGTARVLTFNAIFRTIGTTLPVNTTANKTLYIACIYNAIDAKWDVVAVSEES